MIALFSCLAVIGVFLSGSYFLTHTFAAIVLLSICVVALGGLVAALELHAVEGQRVRDMPVPLTWNKLFILVMQMAVDRNHMAGAEPIYVQTPQGPQPVTGVFTARINHERSIVFDTVDLTTTAEHNLNALKQGVM